MLTPEQQLCTECGGDCCKEYAGIYWPEDVPLTVEGIMAMIESGKCAIDYWEGDPREDGDRNKVHRVSVYWIRPVHTNAIGKRLNPSWGGTCVYLTPNGCQLSLRNRPTQCRKLTPRPPTDRKRDGGCHYEEGYDGKKAAAWAWLPHQGLMDDVVAKVQELEKGDLE